MSQMNFLEKLLDGAEVEWRAIGEVFDLKNGYTPSKAIPEYWTMGEVPWFRMEDIRANGRVLKTAIQSVSVSAVKGRLVPANSLIMSTTATLGEHALIEVPFLTNQQITSFSVSNTYRDKINVKFMFHYFFEFGKWCSENANKNGGMGIIGLAKLKQFKIPIPCPSNPKKSLEIQAEIVRILDAFNAVTAELAAELAARKKQYNYYRDQLLSFKEGDVEWKTLGEVLHMRAGQHLSAHNISATPTTDHSYPCFGGNGVRGFVKSHSHDGNFLLIGRQGALCGNVQRTQGKFYATEHAVVVSLKHSGNINWYFHMLTLMNLNQYASQSAQPGLAVGKLETLRIPIPTLIEQNRIATILDKFDTLTNSIKEGLPREIELRQKQYEYYRNLLFTFPPTKQLNN